MLSALLNELLLLQHEPARGSGITIYKNVLSALLNELLLLQHEPARGSGITIYKNVLSALLNELLLLQHEPARGAQEVWQGHRAAHQGRALVHPAAVPRPQAPAAGLDPARRHQARQRARQRVQAAAQALRLRLGIARLRERHHPLPRQPLLPRAGNQ